MIRTAILVVSDTRGDKASKKPDFCIPAIVGFLNGKDFEVVASKIVKDEIGEIQQAIRDWVDDRSIDLVLTSGGTGVSPRDVTPEATRPLLTKELPGVAEAMRAYSLKKTVRAVLSRAVAGLAGDTLVVNLPGSPKGAVENLEAVIESFAHIIEKGRGDNSDCA